MHPDPQLRAVQDRLAGMAGVRVDVGLAPVGDVGLIAHAGAYITDLLTEYYKRSEKSMEYTKTLAFQIPESLGCGPRPSGGRWPYSSR